MKYYVGWKEEEKEDENPSQQNSFWGVKRDKVNFECV